MMELEVSDRSRTLDDIVMSNVGVKVHMGF
jgi:hypothetical protein